VKEQPATVKVSVLRSTGAPALTCALPGVALTVPPWGQSSVEAVVSVAPAIT
jgi:hypothetical protein